MPPSILAWVSRCLAYFIKIKNMIGRSFSRKSDMSHFIHVEFEIPLQ